MVTLDSLRGIAAFVVVIHHVLLSSPTFVPVYAGGHVSGLPSILGFTPLHILWAGQEAVIVFFVLSGFVLSGPFWNGRPISAWSFALKRMARLYPPYLIAVSIGAILMTLIAARPSVMDHWLAP